MSKPSALPSPRERGPAARRRPRRRPGRRARSRRRPAPPRSAGATPPEDCITSGLGQPGLGRRLAEPAEVAAEQRGEVGVDHRRRAALVLAEARQHLVRGGDVDARAARSRRRAAIALLVGGVEVGEEQADRDRLGAASSRSARREPLELVRRRAARPRRRARSARRPRSAAPALDQRRRLRRAEAVEAGAGPGGRSRAGRRSPRVATSAVRAPRSSSSALVPTVIPWAKASTSRRAAAPARSQHRLDRRHHPLGLVARAWSAPWPCGQRSPSKQDGVGEGPADVDPEQHLGRQSLVADVAAAEGHRPMRRCQVTAREISGGRTRPVRIRSGWSLPVLTSVIWRKKTLPRAKSLRNGV